MGNCNCCMHITDCCRQIRCCTDCDINLRCLLPEEGEGICPRINTCFSIVCCLRDLRVSPTTEEAKNYDQKKPAPVYTREDVLELRSELLASLKPEDLEILMKHLEQTLVDKRRLVKIINELNGQEVPPFSDSVIDKAADMLKTKIEDDRGRLQSEGTSEEYDLRIESVNQASDELRKDQDHEKLKNEAMSGKGNKSDELQRKNTILEEGENNYALKTLDKVKNYIDILKQSPNNERNDMQLEFQTRELEKDITLHCEKVFLSEEGNENGEDAFLEIFRGAIDELQRLPGEKDRIRGLGLIAELRMLHKHCIFQKKIEKMKTETVSCGGTTNTPGALLDQYEEKRKSVLLLRQKEEEKVTEKINALRE